MDKGFIGLNMDTCQLKQNNVDAYLSQFYCEVDIVELGNVLEELQSRITIDSFMLKNNATGHMCWSGLNRRSRRISDLNILLQGLK